MSLACPMDNATATRALGPALGVGDTATIGDLNFKARIPGCIIKYPVARPDGSVDPDSLTFRDSLRKVWARIGKSGWYAQPYLDRVRVILDAGFMVYPASVKSQQGLDAARPLDECKPAAADQAAWDSVVDQCRAIMSAYYKGQLAQAIADGEALERNVAFWDGVYAVSKFVNDIPSNVASGILDTFMRGPILILAVVVVGGFVLYSQRNVLAAKIVAKV
jgi:hypothetical protein